MNTSSEPPKGGAVPGVGTSTHGRGRSPLYPQTFATALQRLGVGCPFPFLGLFLSFSTGFGFSLRAIIDPPLAHT